MNGVVANLGVQISLQINVFAFRDRCQVIKSMTPCLLWYLYCLSEAEVINGPTNREWSYFFFTYLPLVLFTFLMCAILIGMRWHIIITFTGIFLISDELFFYWSSIIFPFLEIILQINNCNCISKFILLLESFSGALLRIQEIWCFPQHTYIFSTSNSFWHFPHTLPLCCCTVYHTFLDSLFCFCI